MDTNEAKIFYTFLICIVTLGIFIALFILSILRHQRRNLQLQKEKTLVEIATLEQERKRIASDMHDDVAPILSAIKMRIDAINVTTPSQVKNVNTIKELLHGAIQKIRETSRDLMPPLLIRNGLIAAIESFCEHVEDTRKLRVVLDIDRGYKRLPAEKEIHLYRMFQEAMHNCIQHSCATTFTIKIKQLTTDLQIIMRDDGKGFNYEQIKKEHFGFGLRNIANRAELLNAQFFLDTKRGAGVRYTIKLPME